MEFFVKEEVAPSLLEWLNSAEARVALDTTIEQARQVGAELQKAREVSRENLALPVTV